MAQWSQETIQMLQSIEEQHLNEEHRNIQLQLPEEQLPIHPCTIIPNADVSKPQIAKEACQVEHPQHASSSLEISEIRPFEQFSQPLKYQLHHPNSNAGISQSQRAQESVPLETSEIQPVGEFHQQPLQLHFGDKTEISEIQPAEEPFLLTQHCRDGAENFRIQPLEEPIHRVQGQHRGINNNRTEVSEIQPADDPIPQHQQQQQHHQNYNGGIRISEIQPADEPYQSDGQKQHNMGIQSSMPEIQANHHPGSQMGAAPFRSADGFLSAIENPSVLHLPSTSYVFLAGNPSADTAGAPHTAYLQEPSSALRSSSTSRPPTISTNSGGSPFFSWGSIAGLSHRGQPRSSDSSNGSGSGSGNKSSRRANSRRRSWLRSGRKSPSDFDWSDTDSEDGHSPGMHERSTHVGHVSAGGVVSTTNVGSSSNSSSGNGGGDSGDSTRYPSFQEKLAPVDLTLAPIEKSHWLQREHKKQKRMRICICLACILCFIVLGIIIAFVFGESIFGTKNRTIPGNHDKTIPGNGKGAEGPGDTMESFYGINKTITAQPGFSKVFYGLDYTPRGSQEPNCHNSFPEIVEDIKAISQLTNRIRLYGMACDQAVLVLKAIEYLELTEMEVVLTIWVDHNARTSWQKQSKVFWDLIDRDVPMLPNQAVPKTTAGSLSSNVPHIIGVSVGNEVLFRNEDKSKPKEHVPVETLIGYMNEVRHGLAQRSRQALEIASVTVGGSNSQQSNTVADKEEKKKKRPKQGHLPPSAGEGLVSDAGADLLSKARHLAEIPVFSSDLGRNAHQIVDAVDQVLSNIHPFFASQSAKNAANWAIANFRTETVKAAKGKPALISEVGWPSGPTSEALGPAVPSMENLQTFVADWVCKANKLGIPYYFFEAFDEPWKKSINQREAQWGIMTVDRQLKVQLPSCK